MAQVPESPDIPSDAELARLSDRVVQELATTLGLLEESASPERGRRVLYQFYSGRQSYNLFTENWLHRVVHALDLEIDLEQSSADIVYDFNNLLPETKLDIEHYQNQCIIEWRERFYPHHMSAAIKAEMEAEAATALNNPPTAPTSANMTAATAFDDLITSLNALEPFIDTPARDQPLPQQPLAANGVNGTHPPSTNPEAGVLQSGQIEGSTEGHRHVTFVEMAERYPQLPPPLGPRPGRRFGRFNWVYAPMWPGMFHMGLCTHCGQVNDLTDRIVAAVIEKCQEQLIPRIVAEVERVSGRRSPPPH